MNEQSNAPMLPEPAGVSAWFSTWMDAVTKPNEETFAAMSERSDAQTNSRAFTWVFLAGTVAAIITGILQAILQAAGFAPQMPGLSQFTNAAPQGVAASLGIALCSSPIQGGLGVLFFAIFVGVVQWVAKMFGGTGNFSRLAYPMAAISVPLSLVSSVIAPLGSLGAVGYCFLGLSFLLGLYGMALQLTAVKGVNRFGWGQAAGSYFLPLLGLCIVCFCVAFGLASVLGLALGDVFNQINQTLAP